MVDREYNMDVYKSVKRSIKEVFFPVHHKTNKMCKHVFIKITISNEICS